MVTGEGSPVILGSPGAFWKNPEKSSKSRRVTNWCTKSLQRLLAGWLVMRLKGRMMKELWDLKYDIRRGLPPMCECIVHSNPMMWTCKGHYTCCFRKGISFLNYFYWSTWCLCNIVCFLFLGDCTPKVAENGWSVLVGVVEGYFWSQISTWERYQDSRAFLTASQTSRMTSCQQHLDKNISGICLYCRCLEKQDLVTSSQKSPGADDRTWPVCDYWHIMA